ncbi:MAG: YggS family pyridoxal phosphate-dependent enzyme [Pseudomonadota bacterium]
MDQPDIASNIAKVLLEVRAAAEKHGRDAESVTLLAVSKTKPVSAVRDAAEQGQRHFGENYLQEASEKIEALSDLELIWHFIGPIQSNKTRPIATQFSWVHSVDRSKILRRLNEHRGDDLDPLNICLQVNVSGEASKSGVAPQELAALVREAGDLSQLRLRGLMAIPAPASTFEGQYDQCMRLSECFYRCKELDPRLDTLSMGMSADLEAAIAAGSTMVRIGTAIFGARAKRS